MIRILGILLAVIFAILSFFHLYWAAGGRFGGGSIIPTGGGGGERLFNPSPFGTIIIAAALFAAMLVVLGRLKIWGVFVPGWIFYSGTWVIALLFLLRAIGDFRYVGFFKSVTDTNFAHWDTILFSPLCLLFAVIAFLISRYEAK